MSWVGFIKELQARDVPVVVEMKNEELYDFTKVMNPEGLFLRVTAENEDEELALLKHVET